MQTFALARFRVVPEPPDEDFYGATDLAVPIIDGTPLFKLVVDRYPGVATALVAPPSRHWLGEIAHGVDGRAVVLDGTCGSAGCCGVFARITVGDDVVVWSDFVARGAPELPDRLHFGFDRSAYETAIAGLLDLQPVDWTIDLDDYGMEG